MQERIEICFLLVKGVSCTGVSGFTRRAFCEDQRGCEMFALCGSSAGLNEQRFLSLHGVERTWRSTIATDHSLFLCCLEKFFSSFCTGHIYYPAAKEKRLLPRSAGRRFLWAGRFRCEDCPQA